MTREETINNLGEKALAKQERKAAKQQHYIAFARTLINGIKAEIANPTNPGEETINGYTREKSHGIAATPDGQIHKFLGNMAPSELYKQWKDKGGYLTASFDRTKNPHILRIWTHTSTAINKAITQAAKELINQDELPDDLKLGFIYMDCRGATEPRFAGKNARS